MSKATVINVNELNWESWQHDEQYSSKQKHLGEACGSEKIAVSIQKIAPGQKSYLAHFHTKDEEHLYAIKGQATLLINNEAQIFQEGDYICFNANTGLTHSLHNTSDKNFSFIVIAGRHKDDVVVFPDTNKVQVKSLEEIYNKEPTVY